VAGKILYHGETNDSPLDLACLDPKGKRIRDIRGSKIAIIFQDPMTCLSPVHTIGNQITESILLHESGIKKTEAREKAVELLKDVGMPRPDKQIDAYTFELSGGMRQRAMIAVALAEGPKLLLADEPTTFVDVTIQAKIIELLGELHRKNAMSILFITHNLWVIEQIADEVAVMYLGKIVEKGSVEDIFDRAKHPYTQLLLECVPTLSSTPKKMLTTIEGYAPDPYFLPIGCPFEVRPGHQVSCFLYTDQKERAEDEE
jgi:peptide/nickel transport system ATP-binding protein